MPTSETIAYVHSKRLFHFPDFDLSAKIPTESSKLRLSFFSRFSTFRRRYHCYAAKSSRLRVSCSCLENLKFHYKRSSRASITSISLCFVTFFQEIVLWLLGFHCNLTPTYRGTRFFNDFSGSSNTSPYLVNHPQTTRSFQLQITTGNSKLTSNYVLSKTIKTH